MVTTATVSRTRLLSSLRRGEFAEWDANELLAEIVIAEHFGDAERLAFLNAELDYRATRLTRKAYVSKLEREDA
jgi:hypothetical protein